MARLWTAGFESQHWHSEGLAAAYTISNSGTATYDTTNKQVAATRASLNCNSGATPGTAYGTFPFTTVNARNYYFRFYIRLSSAAGQANVPIWRASNGTPAAQLEVRLNASNQLQLYNANTAANIGSASSALSATTWYRVEIGFNNSGVASTSYAELKLDGNTVATSSVVNLATGVLTNLYFGWITAPTLNQNIWIDDIAFNDNQTGGDQITWPGAGRVWLMLPTADSARAAGWLNDNGGTTNMFAAVDNTPPAGVTQATATMPATAQIYNATSGTGQNMDFTMQTYTALGIDAADGIEVMQMAVEAGLAVGTTRAVNAYIVSNPAESAPGTFSITAAIAGTYPTNWMYQKRTLLYAPTVTRGTAPVARVSKEVNNTAVVMFCFAGITIESAPPPPVALTVIIAGDGVLAPTMTATTPPVALTVTIQGDGILTETFTLTTALTTTAAGIGTFTPAAPTYKTALVDTLTGIGALAPTLSIGTPVSLTSTLVGHGTYTATISVHTPTTYFANPGDTLMTKFGLLSPGDTLILNDGTYTNGFYIETVDGAWSAPYTIKAAHDGAALIDCGGTDYPLHLRYASWFIFEGLRFQNSVEGVVSLFSDNHDIIFRRCTATGAGAGNYHCFSASNASYNVLFEDCAAWGRGRYTFLAYHSSNVTFRRCFGYGPWQHQADFADAPRVGFGVYGAHDIHLENCIARHCVPFEADANYYTALWNESDDPIADPTYNVSHDGCIFVDSAGGWALTTASGHGTTTQTFRHCFVSIPYNATAQTRIGGRYTSRTLDWDADEGGTLSNLTIVDSLPVWYRSSTRAIAFTNSVFLNNGTVYNSGPPSTHTSNDYSGNTSIGVTLDGTERTTAPTYDTATYGQGAYLVAPVNLHGLGDSGADIGATILYQYVDGTLNSTPLWPWPMEARVVAELGVSPTYETGGGPWKTLAGVYPGQLAVTLPGIGTCLPTLTNTGPVSLTKTISGIGALTPTTTLATALAATLQGVGALAPTLTVGGSVTTYVTDTFVRADQSGFGTASDSVTTYAVLAGPLTLNIVSNEGVISGATATNYNFLAAGTQTIVDTDILFRISISNAAANFGAFFRSDATAVTLYRVRVQGTALAAYHISSGGSGGTIVGSAATITAPTAGPFYWFHAQMIGSTIKASCWADGSSEPAWQYTATDGTPITSAGRFGFYVYTGTSGYTWSVDHLTVTNGSTVAPVSLTSTQTGHGTLTATLTLKTALAMTSNGVGKASVGWRYGAAVYGTARYDSAFALKTALTKTIIGAGTLTATLTEATALSQTLSGVSTLSPTASLATALTTTINGIGAFTPTLSTSTNVALTATESGTGTLTLTAWTLKTALTTTINGAGIVVPALSANLALPGTTFTGVSTQSGTFTETTALTQTLVGLGTLTPTTSLVTSLSVTENGLGTLTGTMTTGGSAALSVTIAGIGTFTPAPPTYKTALTVTTVGVGVVSLSAWTLATALTSTQSGAGILAGTLTTSNTAALSVTITGVSTFTPATPTYKTALAATIAGAGILTPTLAANLALPSTTLLGVGIQSGTFTESTALSIGIAGAGTLLPAGTYKTVLAATSTGAGLLTPTLSAAIPLPSTAFSGTSTTSVSITKTTVLTSTIPGSGTLTPTLTANLALSTTSIALGTFAPTISVVSILSVIIPGQGILVSAILLRTNKAATGRVRLIVQGTVLYNATGRANLRGRTILAASGRLSVIVGAVDVTFLLPTNESVAEVSYNTSKWDIP